MNVFYRYSDGGYAKNKLEKATKKVCLMNFLQRFNADNLMLHLVADNVKDETFDMLTKLLKSTKIKMERNIERTNCGSSAASFKYVYDKALALDLSDEAVVYFLEDDYLHMVDSRPLILEGLELFHFVTLYDHPDKYINGNEGGNPLVSDGGEITRVLRGATRHWKFTNSTTMTFATTIGTLKATKNIIYPHIAGTYPTDYKMFLDIREAGFTLGSCLPGASTHVELQWLTPYGFWNGIADHTILEGI